MELKKENNLFTFKNLYHFYLDCRKKKINTTDAIKFEVNLEKNILNLLFELNNKSYKFSKSICFVSQKPVIREIFASNFRDRIVQHLYVRFLEEFLDKKLIFDSYACRKNKWTLNASNRLNYFLKSISNNNFQSAYYLKLDISWFFMSINKKILFELILRYINKLNVNNVVRDQLVYLSNIIIFYNPIWNYIYRWDPKLLELVPKRKSLFHSCPNNWIPIWNLSSQFFANIYLNELDKFIKHKLKVKYYLRYVDDFVILWNDKKKLFSYIKIVDEYLNEKLDLKLNHKKTILENISYWVKFVWYIHINWKKIAFKKHLNKLEYLISNKTKINVRQKLSSIYWYLKPTINKNYILYLLKHIIMNNYSIDIYNQFKQNNSQYLLIFKQWNFYRCFNEDAIFLNKEFWLKMIFFRKKWVYYWIMCWFPIESLKKFYDMIWIKNWYSFKIFEKNNIWGYEQTNCYNWTKIIEKHSIDLENILALKNNDSTNILEQLKKIDVWNLGLLCDILKWINKKEL